MIRSEAGPSYSERLGVPPVTCDLFFSHHGTPYDIRKLALLMPQADIYFPEFYRYTLADKEMFTTVSEGTMTPDDAMNFHHPFWRNNNSGKFLHHELTLLWQTGIHVGFLDVPANHKLTHDDIPCDSYVSMPTDWKHMEGKRMIRFPYAFDEALSVHRQYLVNDALFHQEREAYIVQAFPKQIDYAVRTNPSLAGRPIRALIQLGLFHAPVADVFAGLGCQVSSIIDGVAIVPSVGSQISRDILAGLPISDERVVRSLMEFICFDMFGYKIQPLTEDSGRANDVLHVFANALSLEEIRDVYGGMQATQSLVDPELILTTRLLEKGIRVPQTIQDMNTLIEYGKNTDSPY